MVHMSVKRRSPKQNVDGGWKRAYNVVRTPPCFPLQEKLKHFNAAGVQFSIIHWLRDTQGQKMQPRAFLPGQIGDNKSDPRIL